MISVCFPLKNYFELHIDDSIYWFNYVIFFGSVSTSESMIPRPCFQALHTVYFLFCYMFACCHFYFRLRLLLIIITATCISLSLHRTSAPIHLTSALGVLGTQETFCIVIAGLLERDSFDLFLPEFDKPWVIHLRETCCCSTNLCTCLADDADAEQSKPNFAQWGTRPPRQRPQGGDDDDADDARSSQSQSLGFHLESLRPKIAREVKELLDDAPTRVTTSKDDGIAGNNRG
jgi:hypothetical protein